MGLEGGAGRRTLLLVAVAYAVCAAGGASAQTSLETAVKANYLVRFTAFVNWPASAFAGRETPLTICVLGPDPMGAALNRAAAGQSAHGRPLVIRRPSSMAAADGCHILYLGMEVGEEAPPTGALVVTDAGVTAARGALHFVVAGGRVRFHIDLDAATRQGLTLNSRLLALALSVQGGPR